MNVDKNTPKKPLSPEQQAALNNELIEAAELGQSERVLSALNQGANIHAEDNDALYLAAINGHKETVALLLRHGAKIHDKDNDSLRGAAQNGHTETVTLLLDHGANIHENNDVALRLAAYSGHTETVDLLLQHGANIHADDDCALRWAAQEGHTETVAFLLQYGANVHAQDDFALYLASGYFRLKTKALLNSADEIEKNYSGIWKKCAYQAAAIAAILDMNESQILSFVADAVAAGKAENSGRHLEQAEAPDEIFRREEKQQALGIRAYLEARNMRDVASEYADAILLPQLLLDAGFKVSEINNLSQPIIDIISRKNLFPLAARELFAGKSVEQMLATSKSWHINGNALPHSLRPYLPDKWQSLVEDTKTPFEHEGEKLVIRCLSDKTALKRESNALKHCVGTGSYYINECAAGNMHILSVQTASGTPLATCEITLTGNPNAPLEENQFRGRNNDAPPAIAKQAMQWFNDEIKSGRIRLNTPQNEKWGHIPEPVPIPWVISKIGFSPTQENIEKCRRHYNEHLLIKENFSRKIRRDGAFVHPPKHADDYRWVSAVKPEPLQHTEDQQWNEMLKELRDTAGAKLQVVGARGL